MTYLGEQDREFAARGATHFHDSHYPSRESYGRTIGGGLFSRHYFNPEGTEIGLVIPDMFSIGMGVQVFEQPRVWGIEHDLHTLLTYEGFGV